MGEVAVLQPHDCLTHTHHHHHHHHSRRRHPSSPLKTPQKLIPSDNHPPKLHNQPRRKRTTPRPVPPPAPSSENLFMGQVKILRRGDHLPGSTPQQPSKGLLPLPQEEVVQIRVPFVDFLLSKPSQQVNGFYAGSAAFVASPPPSSVPLPGFFAKKDGGEGGLKACGSATSDLRRILRLD